MIDYITREEELATGVLKRYWDQIIPVESETIASKMGAEVIFLPSAESGRLEVSDGRASIFVCASDTPARQRFTIAHEIAHWQLGHGNSFRDPEANFAEHADKAVERQANLFAACLLMPRSRVMSAASSVPNIDELARQFHVSRVAMAYRLKNLDLIS